jgi:hypothetical protein
MSSTAQILANRQNGMLYAQARKTTEFEQLSRYTGPAIHVLNPVSGSGVHTGGAIRHPQPAPPSVEAGVPGTGSGEAESHNTPCAFAISRRHGPDARKRAGRLIGGARPKVKRRDQFATDICHIRMADLIEIPRRCKTYPF